MIFRYVPHRLVLDYARLGWDIAATLDDVGHGRYNILMCWRCSCPCVEPKR